MTTKLPLLSIALLAAAGCEVPDARTQAKAAEDVEQVEAVEPSRPVETVAIPSPPAAPSTEPSSPATSASPSARSEAALFDPDRANLEAPATYTVRFQTTKGPFEVLCKRANAPKAADRFYNLVKIGFYDDTALFRMVADPVPFVVQWGIHGNGKVNDRWVDAKVTPDPVIATNARGSLTFALGGEPKTFTTQIFINLANNARLDGMGFAPLCVVTGSGMAVVDHFFSGYGEESSRVQPQIQKDGNAFLRERFPQLDYIQSADVVAD